MKLLSTPQTYHYFDEQYNNCNIRYGDMKNSLPRILLNFCRLFVKK